MAIYATVTGIAEKWKMDSFVIIQMKHYTFPVKGKIIETDANEPKILIELPFDDKGGWHPEFFTYEKKTLK